MSRTTDSDCFDPAVAALTTVGQRAPATTQRGNIISDCSGGGLIVAYELHSLFTTIRVVTVSGGSMGVWKGGDRWAVVVGVGVERCGTLAVEIITCRLSLSPAYGNIRRSNIRVACLMTSRSRPEAVKCVDESRSVNCMT